ncbi:uncharacterized protein LOC133780176 [Humulus lupulus]|uniref:uncharacterized protein LOC133780176 n=1 Tax=Humulus lupulus TaxID=3486 RepID=UPI002B412CD2|nr:uncharacterized protein LOC133780176 [Humulus lupulus]
MSLNYVFFLLFTSVFFPLVNCSNKSATDSLDALLEDFTSKALVRHLPHTGVLYKTIPPANLTGIEVSILKIRSRGLWCKGANFSYFSIPSRTISLPHVRRLALVYQDMKNWSSHYYTVPGYSLITSVVGFMAFDASNSSADSFTKVNLTTMGKPISIHFRHLTLAESTKSETRCVTFAANGSSYLSEMSSFGECQSREQGHFSVVIPEGNSVQRKQNVWHWWLTGFILGFIVLVLLGFAGIFFMRILRTKKIQIMERQADEDLVLTSRWVGQSKMPSAGVTRTQPVLENGCFT